MESSTALRPALPISRVRWTASPTPWRAGRPGGGLGDLVDGGDRLRDGRGLLLRRRRLLGGAGEELGRGRGDGVGRLGHAGEQRLDAHPRGLFLAEEMADGGEHGVPRLAQPPDLVVPEGGASAV